MIDDYDLKDKHSGVVSGAVVWRQAKRIVDLDCLRAVQFARGNGAVFSHEAVVQARAACTRLLQAGSFLL